jgi:predicted double-glycine peptidase
LMAIISAPPMAAFAHEFKRNIEQKLRQINIGIRESTNFSCGIIA